MSVPRVELGRATAEPLALVAPRADAEPGMLLVGLPAGAPVVVTAVARDAEQPAVEILARAQRPRKGIDLLAEQVDRVAGARDHGAQGDEGKHEQPDGGSAPDRPAERGAPLHGDQRKHGRHGQRREREQVERKAMPFPGSGRRASRPRA